MKKPEVNRKLDDIVEFAEAVLLPLKMGEAIAWTVYNTSKVAA